METIKAIAANIRCLILDLDGVMTDGRLHFGPEGELFKAFTVYDGLGLKLLQQSGVEIGVITASKTPIVDRRFETLGIEHVYQGQLNKIEAFENLLSKLGLDYNQVAYVGDDWPDLPLIQRAGLGITVANAISAVKAEANWVTEASGGHGAVREICDLILEAQGTLSKVLEFYGV